MSGAPPRDTASDVEDEVPFARSRSADSRARLRLRPADERRARRHPWAVLGLWAWQATVALATACPAAALVGAAFGSGLRGDGVLWDPGAHALLDFLQRRARGLAPVTAVVEIALVVGVVGGLLPMGAAMVAMARVPRERPSVSLTQGLSAALWLMPSLLFLLMVFALAQGLTIGLGAGLWELVEGPARDALGEARAERLGVAIAAVFALLVSGLGVVHDLSRAAVVCAHIPGPAAVGLGARAFGASPLPVWWSWAWRSIASLVPIAAIAILTDRVGGRGGAALALVAMMHQGVALARTSLRASWLARALRAVHGRR